MLSQVVVLTALVYLSHQNLDSSLIKKPVTIEFVNNMEQDRLLKVGCSSVEGLLVNEKTNYQESIGWTFDPNADCSDQIWCNVSTSMGQFAHFDAYIGDPERCPRDKKISTLKTPANMSFSCNRKKHTDTVELPGFEILKV